LPALVHAGVAPAPRAAIIAICATVSSNIPNTPKVGIDDGVADAVLEVAVLEDEEVEVEVDVAEKDEVEELLKLVLVEVDVDVLVEEVDGGTDEVEGGGGIDVGV